MHLGPKPRCWGFNFGYWDLVLGRCGTEALGLVSIDPGASARGSGTSIGVLGSTSMDSSTGVEDPSTSIGVASLASMDPGSSARDLFLDAEDLIINVGVFVPKYRVSGQTLIPNHIFENDFRSIDFPLIHFPKRAKRRKTYSRKIFSKKQTEPDERGFPKCKYYFIKCN